MTRLIASLLLLTTCVTLPAAEPNWIWTNQDANKSASAGDVYFRRTFNVDAPSKGTIEITADNRYDLFVNGRSVGSGSSWQTRTRYDIGPLLVPGRNLVAVRATNDGQDPAGLVVKIVIEQKDKPTVDIVTDGQWKFSTRQLGNWARPEFDDSRWAAAAVVGEYGKTQPWGRPGAVQTPQPAVVANKPRAYEKGFFDFRDGDRVVLLGSAFIERLQAHGYLETMITAALPDKNITFRNLGWSGDTVWGDARGVFGGRSEGFKRLVNDVNLCQPTVIIVCYGENEAYDGEAGLEAFRGGLNKLLDNLEATGARLLLLSPRRHESLGYPLPDATEYNENLKLYRDVIKETAAQREHPFIDLFDTGRNAGHLTTNGIHLSPRGERIVAAELLPLLGVPGGEVRIEIDLAKNSLHANHVQVFDLETSADRVAFQAVWRGATFDACEGEDGSAVWPTLSIKGLPKGRNCQLIIDGKRQNATTSEALAKGVSLPVGVEQTQSLQKLIADKNTLFFNRYRPQNETYLFLFRKHEQGNNAVEIPQFDPLVAEKEKEIAELKKPVAHKFELKLAD